MAGGDYANGSVHSLTMGRAELDGMLGSAAARAQLLLLDFSASWCGPCRMMAPVLERLAAEHRGRLVVVKMDCEATAPNRDLAAASGISAFPTFHLFRNRQKVAELRGADQAGLRRAISAQLAALGTPGGAGGRPGAGPMAAALAAALAAVKAGCSYDEFVTAARTLLTFVGNALDHPGEERYRRIKLSNAAYRSKLGCRRGAAECMAAIGFREMMEAGEAVLVLSEVPAELPHVRTLLQQALRQAEAAAAGAAAAERRSAAAAAPPAAPTPTPTPTPAAPAAPAVAGGGTAPAAPARPPPATAAAQAALRKATPRALARLLAAAMREQGVGVAVAPAVPAPSPAE